MTARSRCRFWAAPDSARQRGGRLSGAADGGGIGGLLFLLHLCPDRPLHPHQPLVELWRHAHLRRHVVLHDSTVVLGGRVHGQTIPEADAVCGDVPQRDALGPAGADGFRQPEGGVRIGRARLEPVAAAVDDLGAGVSGHPQEALGHPRHGQARGVADGQREADIVECVERRREHVGTEAEVRARLQRQVGQQVVLPGVVRSSIVNLLSPLALLAQLGPAATSRGLIIWVGVDVDDHHRHQLQPLVLERRHVDDERVRPVGPLQRHNLLGRPAAAGSVAQYVDALERIGLDAGVDVGGDVLEQVRVEPRAGASEPQRPGEADGRDRDWQVARLFREQGVGAAAADGKAEVVAGGGQQREHLARVELPHQRLGRPLLRVVALLFLLGRVAARGRRRARDAVGALPDLARDGAGVEVGGVVGDEPARAHVHRHAVD
mmetsp:Transcript_30387/g.98143  ORF Transcript_30387/g.98143 Transcript_30387/m.98143 type:complete len:434 (+) Transcript_30387:551-1852(+)|eukprot:scaffold2325_cov105-Isochrysis_galbana.AAC.5